MTCLKIVQFDLEPQIIITIIILEANGFATLMNEWWVPKATA